MIRGIAGVKVYRSKKMQQEIIRTYNKLLGQWEIAIEEKDIDTPYGMTHIISCGNRENPPLILFHGLGDDSALMWIYNAKHLSQYYRVYAVDTIGGPGKSVPGELYNKEFDDVFWIDTILDSLTIEKAFLAGVSHGGYLVQVYTVCRPQRVIKGISISGALAVSDNGNPMATMMKIFFPEAFFPTKKNVNKLIEKLCGENSAVFTENSDIMEHYTYLLKGFNNMAMRHHKVRTFTENEVNIIRRKVEFLVGVEDPFEKFGGTTAIQENHMCVTFYENAGHGLNHERADEINAKLVEIFADLYEGMARCSPSMG